MTDVWNHPYITVFSGPQIDDIFQTCLGQVRSCVTKNESMDSMIQAKATYYSGIKMTAFVYHETEDGEVICLKSLGALKVYLKKTMEGS